MAILMECDVSTQDHAIVQGTFSGNCSTDTGYAIVTDLYVMTDMNLVHQEVAVADLCGVSAESGPADDYILADMIVITDDQ